MLYRKNILSVLPAGVVTSVVFFPQISFAHAFGQSYTLPLPLWLYLAGSSTVVILSFLFSVLFVGTWKKESLRYNVSEWRIVRVIKKPIVRTLISMLSLSLLALLLLAAAFGKTEPTQNFTAIFIWIIFYLGVTYLTLLVGNIWSRFNPFYVATSWWKQKPLFSYNESLGYYPALLGYFVFIWLELISGGAGARPDNLFLLILCYLFATLLGVILWGRDAWFRFVDFFSVFFSLIGAMALFHMENGKMVMRVPFSGLIEKVAPHPSLVWFILFMLASTAFDGFRETALWLSTYHAVLPLFAPFGYQVVYVIPTIGLMLFPAIFFGCFSVALWIMKKVLGLDERISLLLARYAFTLLPIALAYHVAHYFSLLLVGGQSIIPLLSDPLHLGWDLFDTANFIPNIGIIGARELWNIQIAVIVAGHVVAVLLAHIESRRFPVSRMRAVASQLPMLLLMVIYTVIGLSILALPMGI